MSLDGTIPLAGEERKGPRRRARARLSNAARSIQQWVEGILKTADGPEGRFVRPAYDRRKESTVKGVYVIGDLAGAPVIKLAMADGYNVIEEIHRKPNISLGRFESEGIYDVLVVGAGAAGLNAALAAQERGMSVVVLEKAKIANTIENFPEGKYVYAEPDSQPPKGKLWLDGSTKEHLVQRWHDIVRDNKLDVRTDEELTALERGSDGVLSVKSSRGSYRAAHVVLASGQRGNPKKLGVPGEEQERVYHRLYSPKKYINETILVVGGGNSAVEAAVSLSEQNRVVLSYRGSDFGRLFKDNRRKLAEAEQAGTVEVLRSSRVENFGADTALLRLNGGQERQIQFDHAFVLIGADLPVGFLKRLGLRLENEWEGSLLTAAALSVLVLCSLWLYGGSTATVLGVLGLVGAVAGVAALVFTGRRGNRYCYVGLSFLVWYGIYGIKVGTGEEFWPFRGWGYGTMSFFERPWSFWYTVIYTGLMTIFGIGALKRWGLDRSDRFQIWRFISLISFQWIMFFIIPEYLFQKAVEHRWIGEQLAADPQFADQAWRSYGLVYAWPLFFYTFFYDPHQIWIVWGVLLTFVILPIFVLFHGKRYCSWICGCGGLAETFGDRWRHLAPKGKDSIAWERMGTVILVLATAITVAFLVKDLYGFVRNPAEWGMWFYRIVVDVWLVGIVPVTLYPFLGGKVWCRYWCPLAKMMQVTSKLWVRKGVSRFSIEANDKCISCGECSRYCQVGIDVMSYALKQETLDNETSSCIGCGICVSVCPMDCLSFGNGAVGKARLAVVSAS